MQLFSFELSKIGRKCPNVITSKYQTPHDAKHKLSAQITCTPYVHVTLRRSWSVWPRRRVSPSPSPSFQTASQTAGVTGTHGSGQPGRTCFTFLSLKENNNFTCIFSIIMVAWKCSLTHWTTREVLYSRFFKNN